MCAWQRHCQCASRGDKGSMSFWICMPVHVGASVCLPVLVQLSVRQWWLVSAPGRTSGRDCSNGCVAHLGAMRQEPRTQR